MQAFAGYLVGTPFVLLFDWQLSQVNLGHSKTFGLSLAGLSQPFYKIDYNNLKTALSMKNSHDKNGKLFCGPVFWINMLQSNQLFPAS